MKIASIEILIFVFIYISVCIIFFDMAFLIYTKWIKFMQKKSYVYIDEMIQGNSKKISLKKMKNIYFIQELYKYGINHQSDSAYIKWVSQNLDSVYKTEMYYENKKDEYIAFYMNYLASTPTQCFRNKKFIEAIGNRMIKYLASGSVYVRENTFRAILNLADFDVTILALNKINRSNVEKNKKLMCDNLLGYKGSHEQLVEYVVLKFDEYEEYLQVSFIDYMRLLPRNKFDNKKHKSWIIKMLDEVNLKKEVKLAIFRYLKKYVDQDAYSYLVDAVKTEDNLNWEYAAVASSTLVSYPCEETLKVLLEASSSVNWYVRLNAADSLVYMEEDILKTVMNSRDRYTKSMVSYRFKLKELKEKKVVQYGSI